MRRDAAHTVWERPIVAIVLATAVRFAPLIP